MSQAAGEQTQKLWTRSFVVLILITFSNSFCFQMLNSTLALYVQSIMPGSSVTGTVAGIASLIFTVTIIVARSSGARLLETYGRKPVAAVGACILGLGALLNAWIPTVAALLVLRAVQGLGAGSVSTSISIANIHVVPKSRLAEGMGKASAGGTLSMIIGPSIALLLIAGGDYRVPFYAVAVCCAVTALGSVFITTNHDLQMRQKRADYKTQGRPKLRLGRFRDMICVPVILPSLIQFLVMASFASFTTYLTIYAEDRGYVFQLASFSTAGAFFALASILMVLTQFSCSKFGDRYGPVRVAVPGMALAVAAFLILTFSHSIVLFFAAACLYGVGSGLIMPVLSASVIKGAPKSATSLASSTFYIFYDTGLGLGALAWGVVRDLVGVSGMYAGAAVSMTLAALLTWYVFGRRKWLEQERA